MRYHELDGTYSVFHGSTLRFDGNGWANALIDTDTVQRQTLLADPDFEGLSFLYMMGTEVPQEYRDVFALPDTNGQPLFQQTAPGEFGEVDFGNNLMPIWTTGRSRSILDMGIGANKVGMANDLEDLLNKMRILQNSFPLLPRRTFSLIKHIPPQLAIYTHLISQIGSPLDTHFTLEM